MATDQQIAGATATLHDRPRRRRPLRHPAAQIDDTLYDAFGQREVAQYFTQLNSYHVVAGGAAGDAGDAATSEQALRDVATTGTSVPLSTFVKSTPTGPAACRQPPGPVPVRHAVVQPGAGRRARRRRDRDRGGARQLGAPQSLTGAFQGTAQAFQHSLSSEPYLIAAALVAVYIILGVLYESYIHPLTILSTLPSAGVGALLMLMLAATTSR